jgi:tetratricopeptide (TPR) repeat protein
VSPTRWGAYEEPLNYLWLIPAPLTFVVLAVLKRARLLVVPVLFLLLGAGDVPESVCPNLTPAIEAYENRNYEEAKTGFEACFIADSKNAGLAFALAIVDYHLKDYDQAIHFARSAVRLNPMSRTYRSYVEWLNEKLDLDRPVEPATLIHPDIFFFSMVGFLSAGFLAAAIYLIRRKGLYIVLCILGILLSSASCGGLVQTAVKYGKTTAIVYGAAAQMRKIPNVDANSWVELPEGFSLRVLDSSGKFHLVETANGLTGWVERDDLLPDAK